MANKVSLLSVSALVLALATLVSVGEASIIYNVASDANTVQSDGGGAASVADGWSDRADHGTDGNVYESVNVVGEELTHTVTGLADPSYQVYSCFYVAASGTNNWYNETGLTSGALSVFGSPDEMPPSHSTTGVSQASSLQFSGTPPLFDSQGGGANIELYCVDLGVVSPVGGAIDVFVGNSTGGNRVWFDGVGVKSVPEPAGILLLAAAFLGCVVSVVRRRRS